MFNTKNARLCKFCSTTPCPYHSEEDFARQADAGGQEWLETKPCWSPFPGNVGVIHDKDGEFLEEVNSID